MNIVLRFVLLMFIYILIFYLQAKEAIIEWCEFLYCGLSDVRSYIVGSIILFLVYDSRPPFNCNFFELHLAGFTTWCKQSFGCMGGQLRFLGNCWIVSTKISGSRVHWFVVMAACSAFGGKLVFIFCYFNLLWLDIVAGLLCFISFGLSMRDVHGITVFFASGGASCVFGYICGLCIQMFLDLHRCQVCGYCPRSSAIWDRGMDINYLLSMTAGWFLKSAGCLFYFWFHAFTCGLCMVKSVCMDPFPLNCVHMSYMFTIGCMNIFVFSGLFWCSSSLISVLSVIFVWTVH